MWFFGTGGSLFGFLLVMVIVGGPTAWTLAFAVAAVIFVLFTKTGWIWALGLLALLTYTTFTEKRADKKTLAYFIEKYGDKTDCSKDDPILRKYSYTPDSETYYKCYYKNEWEDYRIKKLWELYGPLLALIVILGTIAIVYLAIA